MTTSNGTKSVGIVIGAVVGVITIVGATISVLSLRFQGKDEATIQNTTNLVEHQAFKSSIENNNKTMYRIERNQERLMRRFNVEPEPKGDDDGR